MNRKSKRVYRLKKQYTEAQMIGGYYRPKFKVGVQGFEIFPLAISSKRDADWVCTQLAVALDNLLTKEGLKDE